MAVWVLSADGSTSSPAAAIVELFVIKGTLGTGQAWQVCAAKSPERPGPYRVLATLPVANGWTKEAAHGALLSLTALLAVDDPDHDYRMVRWDADSGDWAWVALPDDDEVITDG